MARVVSSPRVGGASVKESPARAGARNVIEVRELTRRFGEFTAVDRVGFDVREGEVFVFLGPNGAGKSTTINMLCTLSRPTSGHRVEVGSEGVRVLVEHGESAVVELIGTAGVPVTQVHVHEPTLDDVFMHYTGREIRESHAESISPRMRAHLRARRR